LAWVVSAKGCLVAGVDFIDESEVLTPADEEPTYAGVRHV
jgi:pyridoxal biosynthesis lyase PdxS